MKQAPFFSRLFLIMKAMEKVPCSFGREMTVSGTEQITLKTTTEFDNSNKVLEMELGKTENGRYVISFRVKHPVSNMCYDSGHGWEADLDGDKMDRVRNFFSNNISKAVTNF